ncbi:expressed protein [Dictyostelium purpureum]|uniref:Expressed protein n=1 Tax=Dictyostelium purpureum TaxID=5786 RepID=F1A4C1_DICPU|nr:uncharacterized protein DICPUDRAFT_99986 [Dictyostelium purpureum]EGC28959.1 expressed protein [Dictyostelium purpureum]|eukprot:XP_003294518.1 expressed protein [Dictyostelium purpureum]
MKLYLLLIIIVFNLILNCKGYEIKLTLYNNAKKNCTDFNSSNMVVSFSSTKCGDLGLIEETNLEGTKGKIYYSIDLTSKKACQDADATEMIQVDEFDVNEQCKYTSTSYYHKFSVNRNAKPKVELGMCNAITIFDNDCDYIKIRSFHNNSCFLENLGEYRKYFCIGDKYFTYSCGPDRTCSNCKEVIVDERYANNTQCTGLDPNSFEYQDYLNYYYPKPTETPETTEAPETPEKPQSPEENEFSNLNNSFRLSLNLFLILFNIYIILI